MMTRHQLGTFVETAWLLFGGAVVALALLFGLYWIIFVTPSAAEIGDYTPASGARVSDRRVLSW
jgi:hypothetical protein